MSAKILMSNLPPKTLYYQHEVLRQELWKGCQYRGSAGYHTTFMQPGCYSINDTTRAWCLYVSWAFQILFGHSSGLSGCLSNTIIDAVFPLGNNEHSLWHNTFSREYGSAEPGRLWANPFGATSRFQRHESRRAARLPLPQSPEITTQQADP
jgi:hypothetical protein